MRKNPRESKAMEEARELKRLCEEEVAGLGDEEALEKMLETSAADAREMLKEIESLKAKGTTLKLRSSR